MDATLGEIRMIATSFAPQGWVFCDGSLLSVADNSVLFGILGTTYGGDGSTTFAVPDLRGRVPVGAGSGTNTILSTKGGAETVTLTPMQVPAHSHALQGTSALADAAVPGSDKMLAPTDSTVRPYNDASLATGSFAAFNPKSITPTGPAQAHENRMPSVGINFIIATDGIFPTS